VIFPKLIFVTCILSAVGALASTMAATTAKTTAAPAVMVATTSPNSTKPFSEWKTDKIQLAQDQLARAKSRQRFDRSQDLMKEVTQLEFNLDVAQSLSVTDYVVLYLSTQTGNSKFLEAASHMSAAETAKIMEAYLKAMQSQQQAEKQSERSSSADFFN